MVALILFCMFISGAWFHRYYLNVRVRLTTGWERGLLSSYARSVAVMAAHHLQVADLAWDRPPDQSPLKKCLAAKFAEMQDDEGHVFPGDGDFAQRFGAILSGLETPLKNQGSFETLIRWVVEKSSFRQAEGSRMARDKVGFVQILVKTDFRGISEEFRFAFPVKVSTGAVPGLSKFNLFIEQAPFDGGTDPFRANLVKNDENGDLTSAEAVPVVLDNGECPGPTFELETFFRQGVGFVYLGGAPLSLNLARGVSRTGQYGENFHFYEKKNRGVWDGFYFFRGYGSLLLKKWDTGVVADDRSMFGELLERMNPGKEQYRKSSCFRLYGTDATKPSPTLVFGKVQRSYFSAKGWQDTSTSPLCSDLFFYCPSPQAWADYTSAVQDEARDRGLEYGIATVVAAITDIPSRNQMAWYNAICASRGEQAPFNLPLRYIEAAYQNAYHTMDDPRLESFINQQGFPAGAGVPEFRALVPPDCPTIPELEAYLKPMGTAGDRTAWKVDPARDGNGSLLESLKRIGLLQDDQGGNKLDLNGWVFVANPDRKPILLDRPLSLVSDGGIILEKGDLQITETITDQRNPVIDLGNPPARGYRNLALVTLDGNIVFDAAKGPINASLAANGKVTIQNGPGLKPTVYGAVAAKNLDKAIISKGARICYNRRLAVLPDLTEEMGAAEMLCCSIDPNPLVLP